MNNWKEKIIVGIALLLVFLFVAETTAQASEQTPLYTWQEMSTGTISSVTKNYKFNVGTDGIFVDTSDADYTSNNYHANVFSYASGVAEYKFDTGALRSVHADANDLKYFDGSSITLTPSIKATLTYADNGFSTFGTSYLTVKPYILWNGTKYYADSAGYFEIFNMPNVYHFDFSIGADIEASVYFDALHYDYDVIKTYFGTVTIAVKLNSCDYILKGFTYTSTGENAITDAITTGNGILTNINTYAKNLNSRFNIKLSDLRTNIQTYITDLQTAVTDSIIAFQTALDTKLSSFENSMEDKLDEVIDAITKSYGKDKADKIHKDVEDTLADMDVADSKLREDAVGQLDDFTIPADGFDSFDVGFISAFGFVSSMLQSIYASSGNMNIILSVVFMLTITSMCLGLFRYYTR